MTPPIDNLPDDLESLKRLLAVGRAARIDAEAKAASAEATAARAAANVSGAEALIAHLKLAIEKMRREVYGSRSERRRKLLDQMELELEDVETAAAEDATAAEMAAAGPAARHRWFRRTRVASRCASHSPPRLPRERVFVPGPTAGGAIVGHGAAAFCGCVAA